MKATLLLHTRLYLHSWLESRYQFHDLPMFSNCQSTYCQPIVDQAWYVCWRNFFAALASICHTVSCERKDRLQLNPCSMGRQKVVGILSVFCTSYSSLLCHHSICPRVLSVTQVVSQGQFLDIHLCNKHSRYSLAMPCDLQNGMSYNGSSSQTNTKPTRKQHNVVKQKNNK